VPSRDGDTTSVTFETGYGRVPLFQRNLLPPSTGAEIMNNEDRQRSHGLLKGMRVIQKAKTVCSKHSRG
jgi:hypothetical protein